MTPLLEAAPAPRTEPPDATGSVEAVHYCPPDRIPDASKLVIRDDTPVESFFADAQYRLLTTSLFTWQRPEGSGPYRAAANVGLFPVYKEPPVVPDVMLAVNPRLRAIFASGVNSYFFWEFGRPPDVVFELVSDRRGGEESTKKRRYLEMCVPYYVVFDPELHLGGEVLQSYRLVDGAYVVTPDNWFPALGLGVTLWEGEFGGHPPALYTRWRAADGSPVLTAEESLVLETRRAEQEKQRAEQEKQRAEQLAAKLRELGIDPNTL